MLVLQLFLALPFLQANPWAYLRLAFGGRRCEREPWSFAPQRLPATLLHPHEFLYGMPFLS